MDPDNNNDIKNDENDNSTENILYDDVCTNNVL